MLIGHSRPRGITWTVSGPGATMPGPVGNIDDGRPDTLSALTWLTGTQNTGSMLALRGNWTSGAIVPGLVGLSNLSLPPGTLVKVAFRRSADPAGTYPYVPTMWAASQRVFEGVRGERTAWLVPKAGAAAVVGCEIQIFNDVNGVAGIVAGASWRLGEAVIAAATDVVVDKDWTIDTIDPTTVGYSWSKQPYTTPGVVYRQHGYKLPLSKITKTFGDPANAAAIDYEKLFAKLDRGQNAVYVPRWTNSDGSFSPHLLHRTAIIGIATKLPKATHKAGPMFDSDQVTVIEAPIPT